MFILFHLQQEYPSATCYPLSSPSFIVDQFIQCLSTLSLPLRIIQLIQPTLQLLLLCSMRHFIIELLDRFSSLQLLFPYGYELKSEQTRELSNVLFSLVA